MSVVPHTKCDICRFYVYTVWTSLCDIYFTYPITYSVCRQSVPLCMFRVFSVCMNVWCVFCTILACMYSEIVPAVLAMYLRFQKVVWHNVSIRYHMYTVVAMRAILVVSECVPQRLQKWYVLYVGRHSVVSEVWYTRNEW